MGIYKGLIQAKASRLQSDGAMRVVPGFAGTATTEEKIYNGDQALGLTLISSALITQTTAAQTGLAPFLVPFDAKIVHVSIRTTVTPQAAASGAIEIGTTTDGDLFLDAHMLTSGLYAAENWTDLSAATTLISKDISQGMVVQFQIGLDAATATAHWAGYIQLGIVPRLRSTSSSG